jgi:hypothetical protein
MSENNNTKPIATEEPQPKPNAKKKQVKKIGLQSALDMLTSAMEYIRAEGVEIGVRQSEKYGAVVTLPNIKALQNDWFEPLPNQPNQEDGLPNQ